MKKNFLKTLLLSCLCALAMFSLNAAAEDIYGTGLKRIGTYAGHTYAVYDLDMTWPEAKSHCGKLGGYLTTIASEEEQVFIDGLLDGISDHSWLGGYLDANKWKWVNGNTISYSNWAPGEPNNFGGAEKALIQSNGKWNDERESGDPYGVSLLEIVFICEWNGTPAAMNNYCNVYAPDGRAIAINKSNLSLYKSMGWYESPVCYIVAPDGRRAVIEKELLTAYINVGWIEGAQIYTPDGRTAIIKKSELNSYKAVGWYSEPMCYIISKGYAVAIPQSELYTYLNLGWYEACKIYAPDGRSAIIAKQELALYKAVGWSDVPYNSNTVQITLPVVQQPVVQQPVVQQPVVQQPVVQQPVVQQPVVQQPVVQQQPATGTQSTPQMPSEDKRLTVNGTTYYIGMSTVYLPEPDEKLASVYDLEWYVYGTKDYKSFFVAGVKDEEIQTLISSGPGFDYCGYSAGDVITERNSITNNLETDINDNNIIHAVFIGSRNSYSRSNITADMLAGESKLNFHLTNAFRVYHGLKAFNWSNGAATSAYLHSKDMAENNYFDHTGLDNSSCRDRMARQGVGSRMWGENIYYGLYTGYYTYSGWINSAGHRSNMLNSFQCLGVGAAYSNSGCYFTQNFYS